MTKFSLEDSSDEEEEETVPVADEAVLVEAAAAAPAPAPAQAQAQAQEQGLSRSAKEKAEIDCLVRQVKALQPAAFIELAEHGKGPVIDLLQQEAISKNKIKMIFDQTDVQKHQVGVNENGLAIDKEGCIVVKLSVLINAVQRFVPLYARDFGLDVLGGARNFRWLLNCGRIHVSQEWMGPVIHGIYNNLVTPDEGRGFEEELVARLATHLLHSIGAAYKNSLKPGAKSFNLLGAAIPNFTGGLPWYALENGVDPTAAVPPPPAAAMVPPVVEQQPAPPVAQQNGTDPTAAVPPPPAAAMAPPVVGQQPAPPVAQQNGMDPTAAVPPPPVVNYPPAPPAVTPGRPGENRPLTPKSAMDFAKTAIRELSRSHEHLEGQNATLVSTNATQASTIEHEASTNANLSEALRQRDQENARLRAQLADLQVSSGTTGSTAASSVPAETKKAAKAPKSSKKSNPLLVEGTIVGYKRLKAAIVSKKPQKVTIMFFHGVPPNDAPNENDTSCVNHISIEPFDGNKHFPKQVDE